MLLQQWTSLRKIKFLQELSDFLNVPVCIGCGSILFSAFQLNIKGIKIIRGKLVCSVALHLDSLSRQRFSFDEQAR